MKPRVISIAVSQVCIENYHKFIKCKTLPASDTDLGVLFKTDSKILKHLTLTVGVITDFDTLTELHNLDVTCTHTRMDDDYHVLMTASIKEWITLCLEGVKMTPLLRMILNAVFIYLEEGFPEAVWEWAKVDLGDGTFGLHNRFGGHEE